MYNVRHTYSKKALNYVMRQGKAQFGEGGLNHDVLNSAREFGLVPETAYSGKLIATDKHNHTKMAEELETFLKKVVADGTKMSPSWKNDYENILDTSMGKNVTNFTYEGANYTPKSFLEMTKLNLNHYVSITSFSHEPYYSKFILNIPDNFANGSFYNVPLNEFIINIDTALDKGFSIALDADVSEKTFSGINGVAVVPENEADVTAILTEIKPEKVITQEYRQQEFENLETTDDHLMHIVGKAKDQKGNIYYKVKNSWGTKSGKDGFIYMSVSYMKLKAISVMIHRDALSKKTLDAVGLLYK
jgi:bleomycin hydrolase